MGNAEFTISATLSEAIAVVGEASNGCGYFLPAEKKIVLDGEMHLDTLEAWVIRFRALVNGITDINETITVSLNLQPDELLKVLQPAFDAKAMSEVSTGKGGRIWIYEERYHFNCEELEALCQYVRNVAGDYATGIRDLLDCWAMLDYHEEGSDD